VLTVLTYKSTLGYFLAGSFGSSMVLLFGFPESPFAQPKNVFFGHLVTSVVGVLILKFLPADQFLQIAIAVGLGIFVMILLGVTHPPAGGNPIVIILGAASYDFLLNPIIFGSIIIIAYAIILNRFILKKNYPSSWKS
jgi:CBS-domain-containing membrane protein